MSGAAHGRIRVNGMNQTEARYAQELELRKRVGEVLWYAYEAVKLRLADNTFYTPDFAVLRSDLTLELHEIKGSKWRRSARGIAYQTAHVEEDAAVKIKVAASLFPIVFVLARPEKGGFVLEEI